MLLGVPEGSATWTAAAGTTYKTRCPPTQRTKRGRTKKSEKDPPKKIYGPPTGSLVLVSFCGVTVTANKLANLPIGLCVAATCLDGSCTFHA